MVKIKIRLQVLMYVLFSVALYHQKTRITMVYCLFVLCTEILIVCLTHPLRVGLVDLMVLAERPSHEHTEGLHDLCLLVMVLCLAVISVEKN